MNKKSNIAIIGFGRFGELMANILKPFGRVFILSRRTLRNGFTQIDYPDLIGMDLVIPAVPISALEATLKNMKPFLKKGSTVMDVSSVKVYPCRWMKKIIPRDVQIIGTHPMFGPDSAKNGTKGLQIVVCPLRQGAKTLNGLLGIFKKLGLNIITATPEDHDRQVAKSLALVHFIGRGLSQTGVGRQPITTLGFDRLMAVNDTVNNDTWELFLDMQRFNPYTKTIRKKFVESLKKIEKSI